MNRPSALDFPLHGSRLIEASAGTGKTFTIAALYVRLVLGHGGDNAFARCLLPPEILVVTFTDAATQELRDRIRARLAQAARHFRGELAKPDLFLQALRDEYPQQEWAACGRRLELAAEWMDEAAVSTIHSWCNRMLREHAFDSGSLFTQALETDQSELFQEVVHDYWRTFLYGLAPASAVLLRKRWPDPQALAKDVRGLIVHAEPAMLEQTPAALLNSVAQARTDAVKACKRHPWKQQWIPELQEILTNGAGKKLFNGNLIRKGSWPVWLQALTEWADGIGAAALEGPELGDTGWHRLTPHGWQEAWTKAEPPAHPALNALAKLRDELAALDGQPDPKPALLRHAAAWISRRFDAQQRQRAQMGFDDLLRRLDEALDTGPSAERLAAAIRTQFPVALIDEFQDTDPVQYRIIDRIYQVSENRPEQGVFMIGDPKQAIYSFRGADIYTYLQARAATGHRHYSLDRNFRSTEGMVAAAHRLFDQAEQRRPGPGAFLFRTEAEDPVPFRAVSANGRLESLQIQGQPAAALTCWHLRSDRSIAKGEYLKRTAASCASEIVRLLNLGRQGQAGFGTAGEPHLSPVRPADMAVLVRDGEQADAVRKALASRGVRSVYLSDKESVLNGAEAADVLLWLKACADPGEERHLRAALASATLGLGWAALEQLNQDEQAWEARVVQFRRYRQLWRSQGVLPMLRALLHEFELPARLRERADGERILTNLLHLAELLQRASAELDGEQALIRVLAERRESEEGSGEEQIVRLESDDDLVKVVTIHKSKGLEYPLVFLPFVCTFKEVKGDKPPIRYHDDEGKLHIELSPSDELVARADRERLAEDLRLLYVAVTRARHACWLGVADIAYGGGASDLHKGALGYLLSGAEPIATGELEKALHACAQGCEHILVCDLPAPTDVRYEHDADEAPLAGALKPERAAREHWWIASYSALKVSAAAQDVVEEPQSELEPATAVEENFSELDEEAPADETPSDKGADLSHHGFPPGPESGTFLHGLLEWAAREGFAQLAREPAPLEELISQRCNRRRWKQWAKPLTQWLRTLLQTPIRLSALDETEIPPFELCGLRSYQPELEFWFEAHEVKAHVLDQCVRAAVLPGRERPPLKPNLLNGMLKGFIDLVFEHEGRYYVADYKSNRLGVDDGAYTDEAIAAAVLEKRYDLQYVLYILALHRLLKARLGKDYDYEEHVGGAVYLFLRGIHAPNQGVHFERPPRALIEELDAMFSHGSTEGASAAGEPAPEALAEAEAYA